MRIPLQKMPVETMRFAPFVALRELLAHKQEFFAGMRVMVAVQQAQIGELLPRSEEHTSELQSQSNLVCRLLLEKKKSNLVTDDGRSKEHNSALLSPCTIIYRIMLRNSTHSLTHAVCELLHRVE